MDLRQQGIECVDREQCGEDEERVDGYLWLTTAHVPLCALHQLDHPLPKRTNRINGPHTSAVATAPYASTRAAWPDSWRPAVLVVAAASAVSTRRFGTPIPSTRPAPSVVRSAHGSAGVESFGHPDEGYSDRMAESPEKGRKRLTERDRAADVGESVDEYRRGNWTTEGDPANRARQEAVEENRRSLPGDRAPGTASLDQPSPEEAEQAR
jgi:hypothetical protein